MTFLGGEKIICKHLHTFPVGGVYVTAKVKFPRNSKHVELGDFTVQVGRMGVGAGAGTDGVVVGISVDEVDVVGVVVSDWASESAKR